MSREELGDAGVDRAVGEGASLLAARPHPPGTAPPAPPAPAPVERPDQDGRPGDSPARGRAADLVPRLAVVLAVAALSAALSFAGTRLWENATADEVVLDDDPVAWAVIVDARPAGGVARTVLDLDVRLENLGRAPITLIGSETTPDAGAVESVTPDGLKLSAGRNATVQVHASIDCRSPQPLRMYPLQVRRGDQTVHSIGIEGGTAALSRVCQSQPDQAQVLALLGVTEDGGRLRLTVNSPTGRATEILRLRAGNVTLVTRPLAEPLDAQAHALWIPRPRSCPAEWQRGGLPRTVTADVDPGGPASVTLDVGFALARWLRAGPCPGEAA